MTDTRGTIFLCGYPTIAPWLNEGTMSGIEGTAGLFTPRIIRQGTSEAVHMNIHDLITLTSLMQLASIRHYSRSATESFTILPAFVATVAPEEDLVFLSTGAIHGQELSRFLEVTNGGCNDSCTGSIGWRLPKLSSSRMIFLAPAIIAA